MKGQEGGRPWWRRAVTRGAGLLLTAFALYVVAPSLLALLDAVPSLGDVGPAWFLVVAGAEVASFACLWALLRIALRTKAWFIVVVSQLAGNAASRVLPGGPAAGSVVQGGLLVRSGYPVGGSRCGAVVDRSDDDGDALRAARARDPRDARRARGAPPAGVRAARVAGDRCPAGRARGRGALVGPGRAPAGHRGRLGGDQVRPVPAGRAAGPPAGHRAGPDPGGVRRALGAGAVGRCREPDVRRGRAGRVVARGRGGRQPVPGAARVRRVAGPRAGPDHARRAGLRRGRPDQPAGAGRGVEPRRRWWRPCSTGWRRSGCRSRSGCSPGAGGGPAGVRRE